MLNNKILNECVKLTVIYAIWLDVNSASVMIVAWSGADNLFVIFMVICR